MVHTKTEAEQADMQPAEHEHVVTPESPRDCSSSSCLTRTNLASASGVGRFFQQGQRWLDSEGPARQPCPASFPTAALLFSGKAPESDLANGGFVPEKRVASPAETSAQEVSKKSRIE